MTEKFTKEDVERLVREANSPNPLISGNSRPKLIALSKNADSLPDEATKAWVISVVRDWILPSG
jgi:hypothetical protein